VIAGIKSAKIGYLGIDVYEQEADLFSEDLSTTVIQDDDFQLLKSFPNVVITAHQAFFTQNALQAIAETTIANITDFEQGRVLTNQVKAAQCDNMSETPDLAKIKVVGKVNPHARIYDIASIQ
jgi:D-lactate dehydrogenase